MSFACIHSFDAPGLGQAQDGGDREYGIKESTRWTENCSLSWRHKPVTGNTKRGRLLARVVERVQEQGMVAVSFKG